MSNNKKKLMWGALALILALMVGIAIWSQNSTTDDPNPVPPPQVSDNTNDPGEKDPTNTLPGDSSTDDPSHSQDPNGDPSQTQDPNASTTNPPSTGENDNKITVGKVTNLKGTIDGTSVTLTWNKASNATGYEVYIKTTDGSYVLYGTVTNNTAAIKDLTPGKTVCFKVRGIAKSENNTTVYGNFSNEVEFTIPEATKPSEPTKIEVGKVANLKGTVDGTSVTLTWDKATNATGYEVYIKTTDGSYILYGTVTNNTVVIKDLTPGKTVWFKVRGTAKSNDTIVYGEFSAEAEFAIPEGTKPNEPVKIEVGKVANLKGTATYTTVTLTWDAVKDANGYEVYRKVGDSYEKVGTTSNTELVVTGLQTGTIETFKVRAYILSGNETNYGDYSKEVQLTLKKLSQVKNLKSTVESKTAKLTWDKVTNAKGYEVYQKQKDGTYKLIATVTTNSCTLTDLTPGSTLHFKVRAFVEENGVNVYGDFSEPLRVEIPKESGTGDDDNTGGDDDNHGGGTKPGEGDKPIGGDKPIQSGDGNEGGGGDNQNPGGDDNQGGGGNNQGGGSNNPIQGGDGNEGGEGGSGDDQGPGGDEETKPSGGNNPIQGGDGNEGGEGGSGDDQGPGGEEEGGEEVVQEPLEEEGGEEVVQEPIEEEIVEEENVGGYYPSDGDGDGQEPIEDDENNQQLQTFSQVTANIQQLQATNGGNPDNQQIQISKGKEDDNQLTQNPNEESDAKQPMQATSAEDSE